MKHGLILFYFHSFQEAHQTIFQKKIFYSLESVNSLILIRLLSGDFNQLVQSFI